MMFKKRTNIESRARNYEEWCTGRSNWNESFHTPQPTVTRVLPDWGITENQSDSPNIRDSASCLIQPFWLVAILALESHDLLVPLPSRDESGPSTTVFPDHPDTRMDPRPPGGCRRMLLYCRGKVAVGQLEAASSLRA